MKIVLNYDNYGNINDNNGNMIGTQPGLEDHALVEKEGVRFTAEEVLQLKEAGLGACEIITMREAGVI